MALSVQWVWLIPALPLLAAAVGVCTPRRGRGVAAGAAITALAAALVLAGLALRTALNAPPGAGPACCDFDWIILGRGALRLGWLLDPLAAFMLVMIALVGLLVFIFSLGYMDRDPNFARFFCFLSLFAAAMLGLVIANSLLLLFVCWELVGLASYLLIGFWYQRPAAAAAAKKAFLTTRVGDLALLLGMLWLYDATGSLLFFDGGGGCLEAPALAGLCGRTVAGGLGVSTAIGLLLFVGAMGKSGQVPLHVWLPDAMEGPTPVSALIHAATMVAAGVFLVARTFPLMAADLATAAAPVHALTVIAFSGAITALVGALLAVAQTDLKRVLAFSTISQLGYMMLALGVGSWVAAVFHLLTHACFKALLFLGAGSVIHAAQGEQDIRRLGGLAPRMRVTFATFAVGMMALAGVPFLFSGFWSKEAILAAARSWPVSGGPLYLGLTAVALTALYMTRLVAEVFFGRGPRGAPLATGRVHEGPAVMTLPLAVLAILAAGLGFLGTPVWPWLQARLDGSEVGDHVTKLSAEGGLLWLSAGLVGLGLGLGWWLYGRRPRRQAAAPDPLAAATPALWRALAAGLGFDELYRVTVVRMIRWAAGLADEIDRRVWDGLVRGVAAFGEFGGIVGRQLDEDGLNAGFDDAGDRLRRAGRLYARAQTGAAHGYLRTVAVGFVLLVLLLVWGGMR
ncbi:MAG TPA: NADH-quinone oxidoreductase subunit L [Opitutaceae bacterium]|nr:NADH-quinone oxidoreductase subunit L [Opitutaceae bacterium]